MRNISRKIISIALAVFCLALVEKAAAQSEPAYTDKLPKSGDSIAVGKTVTVMDSVFFNETLKPSILRTNDLNNIVSLRINEYGTRMMPDSFLLSVKVRVIYIDEDEMEDSITEKTLSISYYKNKAYNSKAVLTFKGAYWVQVKVLEITASYASAAVVLPLVELENLLYLDRDYTMLCADDAIQTISKDTSTISTYGELKVSWEHKRVAEMYDVEWTYLDKSALDAGRYTSGSDLDPKKIFRNNATRITTKADTCMIPLLYDGEGSLFYRVRCATIDPAGEIQTTTWSSTYSTGLGRYDFNGHERKLNWQATTTYAEEGKRKSVVQYFDGSLRGRQTVTRDNTTRTTVVAETFYDKQGRAVIQVMPAPTLSKLIAYTPGFNVADMNGREYDKGIYDTVTSVADYCNTRTDSMSVISGAAKYYSVKNPLKDEGFNKFIPNAHGYAFTETQYMQDNSGRVYRQGGVDSSFGIGSGHETKYYYGNPEQTDLDALFGTEVGDASHYQKNMVRDANGQYSVSYVDMHGRTIATALAGNTPTSLQQLDSYRDSVQTEQLLNASNNIINGTSIESSKSLLVTRAGIDTFHYSLGAETLTLADCQAQNICYDCLYDLVITISDDCNNQLLGGSPIVIAKSNFSLYHVDTVCNTATPIDTTFAIYLNEGSYTISKKLSISKYGMDYYRDSLYLPHNTCQTYTSILNAQLAIIRTQLSCNADTLNRPSYYGYRDQMLQDLYPLSGQYGDSAILHSCMSIFDKSGGRYLYQAVADTGIYRNDAGDPDYVVNSAGSLVAPQYLTPDEFISNFKESWLINLLSLHPEYRLLVEYETFRDSYVWDDDFNNTKTYAEALAKGYLNPTGSSTSPASRFTAMGTPLDPLYYYSVGNTVAKPIIEDSLFEFRPTGDDSDPYLTMWGFATIAAKCGEPITSTCAHHWNASANVFNADSLCTGELDMAWTFFREMYQQQKRAWIDKYMRENAATAYPMSPCNPVFPKWENVMQEAGFSGDYTGGSYQADSLAAVDSLNKFYEDNCNAYTTRWLQQLGSCNYSTEQANEVKELLVAVCKEGADINHPFGASSVKPGSTNTYKSFDEVIKAYNTAHSITNNINCNAYLIDKPLPYDQPAIIVNKPLFNKPDSCECARISSLYSSYMSNAGAYGSFSNYMLVVHHTSISQGALDTLRNLCSGTITCKFIPTAILLPPALQCGMGSVCVGCDSVQKYYDSFLVKFPSQYPTLDEPDTTQQRINSVFASYLNQHLGFANTAQDYLHFKQQCDSTGSSAGPSDTALTCSNFNALLRKFPSYYDSLINWARPPIYDSSGCDRRYWAVTDGSAWNAYAPYYRQADFLSGGIWRHPVADTIHPKTEFDFFGTQYLSGDNVRLCIDTAFSLEMKVKFPIDSLRQQAYFRNGGTSTYGAMKFEMFFGNSKLFGYFIPATTGTRLVYYDQLYSTGNIVNYKDTTIASFNFEDWKKVKYKFADHKWAIYVEDTLRWSFTPTVTLGGRFNGFDIGEYGYDMQFDWMKFYDYKDSLRMTQNFTDCNWADPGFNHKCVYPCDTTFKDYFNSTFHTTKTYSQIAALYAACNITLQPCVNDSPADNAPRLCGKIATDETILNVQEDPCADSSRLAIVFATERYRLYRDSLIGHFNDAYTAKCLNAAALESFTVKHPVSEYHYTLYYYDQAGNLVKTIPPEGVRPNRDTAWQRQVREKRLAGDVQRPTHQLPTVYRYNSLNQVVTQKSPDGGLSKFWYDRLGRLVISQNAKQLAVNKYSYTKYDAIGRIYEVGEKLQPTAMNNTISRSVAGLRSWLMYHYYETDYLPHQVTATMYDEPSEFQSVYDGLTPFKQKSWTLRNRVSWTRTYDILSEFGPFGDDSTFYAWYDWFNTGIEYSYDIHGNVDSMLNVGYVGSIMNVFGANAYKMIAYKYDLISGKVNEVHYNPGFADEFYHRYEYDAENRLTDVYTTDNKVLVGQAGLEEHDAHYEYYKHGPLARAVIGHQQVQGIDYAYTLQGWLKGVNSINLDADYDMGNDGKTGGTHANVARDAYGFNLNYFTGEYAPINTTIEAFPGHISYLTTGYRPLYNGNISSMAVNIGLLRNPRLYNYQYDQLNRIVGMDAYKGLSGNSWSGLAQINDFKERVTYDGNGNIKKYLRNGYGDVLRMDSLTYKYNAGTNQLNHVKDSVDQYNYASDIDNQSADNYTYDAIGNLTSDAGASITGITWNVYGKIASIAKATTFKTGETTGLEYRYDPSGNRVQKITSRYGEWGSYEWYVRDAQGNVMAVYRSDLTGYYEFGNLKLKEQHLYGSSRLGIIKKDIDMTEERESVNTDLLGPTFLSNFNRGKKQYELTNHLGNVLVTVADTKTAIADVSSSSLIDHYTADVITANDYYPFGMLMPGRTNTELQDADSAGSPTPIHIEAEDYIRQSGGITTESCDDTGGGINLTNISNTTWAEYSVTVPTAGTYLLKFRVAGSGGSFQFKDSSLNVLTTVTIPNTGGGQTWTTVTTTVVLPAGTQKLHFYTTWYGWNLNWFELILRGANGASTASGLGGYRYGFNGKERDDEINGDGNQYDYGFRIYNPRLGRFLSVDPLFKGYPWYTPYQFAGNKPIWAMDLDGLEEMKANSVANVIKDKSGNIITVPTIINDQSPSADIIPGVRRLNSNQIEVTPGLTGKPHPYWNTFTWQQVNGKNFYCDQSVTPLGQDAGGTPPKTNLQQDNEDDHKPTGTTTVITPTNNTQVQNQALTRNIDFVSGEPQFSTDADRQMVNNVANNAPNTTTTGSPVTTTRRNTTTTTTTTRQVRSIITIDLKTDRKDSPESRTLLTNRYNLIRRQLIGAGVPGRNIRRGGTDFDNPEAHATNTGNQTIFRIRTTRTTTTTGTSSTTTSE